MTTLLEGFSIENDLRPWLLQLQDDRISDQIRRVAKRDMIYMYLNHRYPPDTTDLLFSDSVELDSTNGTLSIVGLVVDDRDTVKGISLLNKLKTVIVHSEEKLNEVREQLPDVTIVLDDQYRYLNNSDNGSRITESTSFYEWEEIADNTYKLE